MAKRFIDSTIWDDEEFLDAGQESKLLFFYILTRCDNIGVFKISLRMASFQIGFKVTESHLDGLPLGIEKLANGKYWMPAMSDARIEVVPVEAELSRS